MKSLNFIDDLIVSLYDDYPKTYPSNLNVDIGQYNDFCPKHR